MDHYDMAVKLSDRANVTFADAKEALDQCNWDMLEAIVMLEEQGKTAARSAAHTTENSSTGNTACAAQCAEQEDRRQREEAHRERTANRKEKTRETAGRCKRFLCDNRLIMNDKQGKELFSVPIWIPAVVLLAWFWAVLIVFVVCLLLGCRFRFSGPNLGRESVNNVMDKMGNTAEHIRSEFSARRNDSED